jgi:hypothetical protein
MSKHRHAKKSAPLYLGQTLSIRPSCIFAKPDYDGSGFARTAAWQSTAANLRQNSTQGLISVQAAKKMRSAIEWLYAASAWQRIWDKASQKHYVFRCNFITLTVPAISNIIKHNTFVAKCLNPFLVYARKYFALKNYVWKVEITAQGLPHIHLVTDTFINHSRLRKAWNKILVSRGYLDGYIKKYSSLSLTQYLALNPPNDTYDISHRMSAYNTGRLQGWQQPNSTDVHALSKVKNVCAYLCEYLGKSKTKCFRRKGRYKILRFRSNMRLWGSSLSLSSANKLRLSLDPNEFSSLTKQLYSPQIESRSVDAPADAFGRVFNLGRLFFIKAEQWATVLKGTLYDAYKAHLFKIRHNVANYELSLA